MKNFFLKSLLFVALSLGIQAQTITSGGLTGATNNLVSTVGQSITYLTLTDTSGTNNLVIVYDNDVATTTNIVRPAYTAKSYYATNIVNSYTNPFGVTQSVTNSVLYPLETSVAATTNEANRIFVGTIPANGSLTFSAATYGGPLGTTRGVVIKAANAGNYLMQSKQLPY